MKYRILLVLALMCAILFAAVNGTLAGYTDEAAMSFSIRPDTSGIKPKEQQTAQIPGNSEEKQAVEDMVPDDSTKTAENMVPDDGAQSATDPPQDASDEAPAEGIPAPDANKTSEREAMPQN